MLNTALNLLYRYCRRHELQHKQICNESDVQSFAFPRDLHPYVEDIRDIINRIAPNVFVQQGESGKSITLTLSSRAIAERIQPQSDLATRLDLAMEDQYKDPTKAHELASDPIQRGAIVPTRKRKMRLKEEAEPGLGGIAAENDPEKLKDTLVSALDGMKLEGTSLLRLLNQAGIKCKWQESRSSLNAAEAPRRWPYLQFYKMDGEQAVNLYLVDVQTISDKGGMEDALRNLIGLARGEGIGSVDVELERAATIKKALGDAAKVTVNAGLVPGAAGPAAAPAAPTAAPVGTTPSVVSR